jgi:hypothetical protein
LIILADEGKVLSWGFGGHGQLGHSSIQSQKIPAVIDALADQRVIYIACGGSSSAAITGELRYDLKMHFQYLFFLMQEKLSNPTIWLILQGCRILLPRVAPLVNQKADGIILLSVFVPARYDSHLLDIL